MIHHYFSSKKSLYDAIIQKFSQETFDVALRVIAQAPRSAEEFKFRMAMFITETLEALIAQAPVFRILTRDQSEFVAFSKYHAEFIRFLEQAKAAGYLRDGVDIEMISGLILDRLGNQVLFGTSFKGQDRPNVLTDATYRDRWLAANIDILVNGFAAGPTAE